MTRIGIVIACVIFVTGTQTGVSEAGWGEGPGCGLGVMAFKTQPKSILMQLFGSTLNVPTQPFAITSGTSGCTNAGVIVKREAVNVFLSQNVEAVSQDMAKGHGEYITSLATLMDIPADRHTEFFRLAQGLVWDVSRRQGIIDETMEEDTTRAIVSVLQRAMIEQSGQGKDLTYH